MGGGGRKSGGRGGVALDDSSLGNGGGATDDDNASGYEYEDAHAMMVNGGKKGGLLKKGMQQNNLLMTGSKSTGGRSSISDVEMLRRGVGGAGSVDGSQASSYLRRGGALGSEAGEGSIVSEDSLGIAGKRGLRRAAAAGGRLSTGMGALDGGEEYIGGAGGAGGAGNMELDADEAAMAAMMEGASQGYQGENGGGDQGGWDAQGGYADDMMMGDHNAGYGDYQDQQQQQQEGEDGEAPLVGAAAGKKAPRMSVGGGAGEGFDAGLGGYQMSEEDIQLAQQREAEKQAKKKQELKKKRDERAAERKAKRDAAVAAASAAPGPLVTSSKGSGTSSSTSLIDAAVILKGDTIKTWLADTSHITRPRRDLNDHKTINALAERLKQTSLKAAEKKANAVVSMMTTSGPFSKDLADTLATNPAFAAMRADQLAALPALTGWDGLILGPSVDPALVVAMAGSNATGLSAAAAASAEAAASAHLEERILQAPGAYSTTGILPGLGLSSLNPEVSLLAAGNLHGRVRYPLAEAPLSISHQHQQLMDAAGQEAGIVMPGEEEEEEQQQDGGDQGGWDAQGGYADDMMMGDHNAGYGDFGAGEEGLPLDGGADQQQQDLSAQLLQQQGAGAGSAGGLLASQSPAGSTGTGTGSSISANSKLGGVFATRESVAGSVDISTSQQPQQQQQVFQSQSSSGAASGGIESASGKWHSQTRRMLEILASEMTGPQLPPTPEEEEEAKKKAKLGRKRKASEMEEADNQQAPRYDLSDLKEGKGSVNDPVSFLTLAADADASQVAVSFLHLLQLKTWDIIDVQQETSYEDVGIVRTNKFATALADVRKGLH
jgi:Conserved region of Rad21 / Rec8 like protein